MRHLFLLAGEPAVGKSSWIKENGFGVYTLSPDSIRVMMETPRMGIDGKYYISQKNDKKVWGFLFMLLEEKMKRGETVFIDATHSRARLINQYRRLAKKYRYRVTVINFHGRKNLEELFIDNKMRGYKAVPEKVIKNIYHRLETMQFPGWVQVITPEEFTTEIIYDWNEFDYIVVFGDIHGNFYTFLKLFEQVRSNVSGKTAYVFIGDYFDRGNFNAETFHWLIEFKLTKVRENNLVIYLTGNHEFKWLPRYREFINGEFVGRKPPQQTLMTYQQFKENKITVKEVEQFYNSLGQLVYVKFGDKKYIITHGGIPVPPTLFTPTEDFIFGVGNYEDSEKVDEHFSKLYGPMGFISIHGHRNIFGVPIHNTEYTYNINGDAEVIGGELRALVISKSGEIKEFSQRGLNPTIKKPKKKFGKKIQLGEILSTMRQHDFVKVKDLGNNTYAINFTSRAFKRRAWDYLTMKARGLFIGITEEDNEVIIARSYEKFFNLNEREETKLSNFTLATYPAVAYKKYNGFLGLLSIDPRTGEWFISTKGSITGEFVEMFKEVITPYLTNELKEFLFKSNTTMVFEVIHKNDPHIVDYNGENFIVLLDIIFNEIEERKFSYENLIGIGKKFSFMVKEKMAEINNYQELLEFITKLNSGNLMTNEGVEGTVIEFSDGFKVKVKTEWYKFWKMWRGKRFHVQKIKGDKGKINQFKEHLHKGEDFVVLDYMLNTDYDLTEQDIISIRKKILA